MPIKSKFSAAAVRLGSDRARFIALAVFLVLTFLTGGGARDDIQSLALLRPAAVFFAAYALSVDRGAFRMAGVPFYLLLSLAVLIAVQLVPLPPSVWKNLPGRELHANIAAAVGMGDLWRPLSLSPSKTLNSLFSLMVPIAAVMLLGVQSRKYLRPLLILLVSLISASALWGLLQLAGSANGPLYFYRVTNAGLPVGFFANRNHQAVLLGACIPLLAHLGVLFAKKDGRPGLSVLLIALTVGLVVPTILMTGSRAGLIAAMLGLSAAAVIIYLARQSRPGGEGRERFSRLAPIALSLLMLAAVVGSIALWFGRALAIERLLASDTVDNLRAHVLPILMDMIAFYFPFGAGFGSFEHVYYQFEPIDLLREQYLNQAHNDWLQLIIEGGLPAALLLVAFIVWLGRQVYLTFSRAAVDRSFTLSLRVSLLAFVTILGVASFFDYPLRVPSVMCVFVISCGLLARNAASANDPGSAARGSSRDA